MPIPIDDPYIINETLPFSSKEKDKITLGEKQSFPPNETTRSKNEFLPCTAKQNKIEEFIEEIQTTICKSINNNKTKSQIKKQKHMKYKYIPHAIRDYHKYEEKVRELEQIKIRLGIDISTARRKNDNKALDNINKKIYYLRLDIEDAVYMRTCILNEVRKIPGYDKFANKKCEFFFTNTGCLNGDTCPYRH